ncbi:23S rRNA (guanosine(2251)-2'-O)-methyltransferase RlmB [Croceitalea sp. MTPC5]|uniref:23S rRNA (guanosine(2251)-2'-O)-methyltransferase RlmB n=1 Tax=Croceitalea sp. MTPC5 TaxID=3056565 RepID=UPI002B375C50|nr:23S rRNA (guanosine(2251)-2'-O)-methyltransferase RlmB [Croceitalea sp. MTPC5]
MKNAQLIYGIRAIIEAIEANKPINKLFIQRGLKGGLFQELEHKLRKNGIGFSYVPVEKLNRLTRNNHQGAIAQISPVAFHDFEVLVETILKGDTTPLFLLLDQITDVRNFGAIIRTAECTGVNGIIIPKSGSAPITDDTIKTSAGAAFKVPIAKVNHLKDAIFYLQQSGIQVLAATEKAAKPVYGTDLTLPSAILMGSEDKGISTSILNSTDIQAKLPQLGTIGSLNVSVACGVFLYEAVRQRTT